MKLIIALVSILTLVPVSLITMIWGWGLTPHNWGWIAFGYLWMIVPMMVNALYMEGIR